MILWETEITLSNVLLSFLHVKNCFAVLIHIIVHPLLRVALQSSLYFVLVFAW